jgi:hypothetical protein
VHSFSRQTRLQLDEILQLIGTRIQNPASIFGWMKLSPGAVPGAYLVQWALLRIAGFSNLSARLMSIIASLITAVAMMKIGALMGIRRLVVLAVLVAMTPMLFRYSIEGRPYSLAFCLTVLATLLIMRIAVSQTAVVPRRRLLLSAMLLCGAALVQGQAIFIAIGLGLFIATDHSMRRNRRLQLAALAATGLSLPIPLWWYFIMRDAWARDIAASHLSFTLTLRTAAGFLKDLTMGGVVSSGLLLAGAVYGYARSDTPRSLRNLMGITALTAIFGALASDAHAGYFLSPRQAIYSLAGLIVLATAGAERFLRYRPTAAVLTISIFVAVSGLHDASIVRSAEDWRAASVMVEKTAREGFCIQMASEQPSPLPLYSFFAADLEKHRCAALNHSVALVYSVYTPPPDRAAAEAILDRRGLRIVGIRKSGGTTLEQFRGN